MAILGRSPSTHLFEPSLSRQTCGGRQLEPLAACPTSGSFAPLITHHLENRKITVEEIDAIIQSILKDER